VSDRGTNKSMKKFVILVSHRRKKKIKKKKLIPVITNSYAQLFDY
jgi:hypothetical protein